MSEKIFSSACSKKADPLAAIEDLAFKVNQDLNGKSCDFVILFFSEGYPEPKFDEWVQKFYEAVSAKHIIGCNACGVIGDHTEIEMKPAVTALAMHLPDVKLVPFEFSPLEVEQMKTSKDLIKGFDFYPNENPKFICFADPMSCDITKLLEFFDDGYPSAPVVGGLASGTVVQTQNWLWLDGEFYSQGAVGMAMLGNVEFLTIVSQGCRPIGEPLAITKSEKNVLFEIAGRPAVDVLRETYEKLTPEDQNLAKHALFIGLAMDEHQVKFERGDFLIRNIMGADQEKGALAVGELLEPGQTMQFQLRDRKASTEDLQFLLKQMKPNEQPRAEGALLVSCCGRGRALFSEADHDVRMIQSHRGPLALTGFFANGEFGPINNKNYIHGYTSSLTIIY